MLWRVSALRQRYLGGARIFGGKWSQRVRKEWGLWWRTLLRGRFLRKVFARGAGNGTWRRDEAVYFFSGSASKGGENPPLVRHAG